MTANPAENSPDDIAPPPVEVYAPSLEAFLAAATWLDPLIDGPWIIHARAIATSLDQQLTKAGEVQSALASTYAKVLTTLVRNRPAPTPGPTDPAAPSPDGTASIFTQLT